MAINALIENLQRQDLDVIEIAISLQNLLNERIFKNKSELSQAIGKTNAYVSKVLSILNLEPSIIKDIELNKTIKDIELLYELQKVGDLSKQKGIYKLILNGEMSRNELRELNKKQIIKKAEIDSGKTTHEYFKVNKNSIVINASLDHFDDLKKKKFQDELEKLLKKYMER